MHKPVSISPKQFTNAVQAGVKAAQKRHSKFEVDPPGDVSISYLIWGFPIPDTILATVTMGEAQAYATDVASHIASKLPEVFSGSQFATNSLDGALLSIGRHVICGIPPFEKVVRVAE